jgi:hypothetical protein
VYGISLFVRIRLAECFSKELRLAAKDTKALWRVNNRTMHRSKEASHNAEIFVKAICFCPIAMRNKRNHAKG